MKLKKALFWKNIDSNKKIVQCQLCPHFCSLKNEEIGKCHVRQNKEGILYSLVYGKPVSIHVDPIEKKPLYHFLPGKSTLSIATQGCNLSCEHCQNWEISQAGLGIYSLKTVEAKETIGKALEEKTKIISYTYTEPTIFYEYMLDIAKLGKKKGLKNVTVTNGFINTEPLTKLSKYIDGSNIDLKSIDNNFYAKVCGARLSPVLESIKLMKKQKVWIEITNLLIPGYNADESQIKKLVEWILDNLGDATPLHFSAFFPTYKLQDVEPTEARILRKARKLAMDKGLKYVYTGNVQDDEGNHTYCPKCGKIVIKRLGFRVIENNMKGGRCICGEKIPGIWE